ncbi:DMT family transporter [Nisaea sp.]|uniref:DMT family transporter n=1 Tax=Nisaea sp. TaxID=2024842 RepID=UPI003B52E6DF
MGVGAVLQVIVVMLLWAVCFPLIAVGIEFSPHLTFAALRALLAGLALLFIAIWLRKPLPSGYQNWTMLAIVGLGATSLGFLGMFHAAEFVSPGIATVIANTQPLLAAGLAGILLKERLTARGKAGLALGFAGILVITSPHLFDGKSENYLVGVGYIALAALGVTVSNVVIKRIAGSVDALMAMGLQLLIGSIPLAVIALIMEEPTEIDFSLEFVATLLVLSLFGSALVYWLWFSVLEKVPLNSANAFSFLIPIFGLTMGVLFYGESIGLNEIVGIALAILGVALVTYRGAEPLAGS